MTEFHIFPLTAKANRNKNLGYAASHLVLGGRDARPYLTLVLSCSIDDSHLLLSPLYLDQINRRTSVVGVLKKRGLHMRRNSKIKTRVALVACLLTFAIAMPGWSDTLIFRNGTTLSGTLTGANSDKITFRDRNGQTHGYFVRDVEAVQFGDAPDQSRGGPGGSDQPGDNHRDDRDNGGSAQGYGNQDNRDNGGYDQARMERVVLPAGTELSLRTNERIDSKDVVEGQTFSAQIAEDIRDTDGSVAIPRGSDAKLITRRLEGNGDITLDVESISVEGRRYRVSTADQELENHRDGVGANKRTGQFVGGGAVFGAIIGAIAGGGKGAAIGAAAGAGAGAGAQIVTRGKEVHVPAESVIRFRLDRPLKLHLWS
jgi:hypothetical protein